MVFCLQNVVEKHRLKVPPNLEYWPETEKELLKFSPKVNPNTLHVSYEAIIAKYHDDLVIAVAQDTLFGEKFDTPYIYQSNSQTVAVSMGGDNLSTLADLSPGEQWGILEGDYDIMNFAPSVPDTEQSRQLMKGTRV
jgi:hypothetical protein